MTPKKEKAIVVCACLVTSVLVGLAMPWIVETLENLWAALQDLWGLFLTM